MSLFGKILEKLGLKPKAPVATTSTASPSPASPSSAVKGKVEDMFSWGAPKPAPMDMVDVVAKLEAMAKKNPQDLNWKRSIVDLLKLLGLDSSFGARKELATELGCPVGLMGDSASMNTWLHKAVLRKLAENGGNIPKELLD